MMTASKYCVVWCYREGDRTVRRTLHSAQVEPCVEAARLINGNPFAFEVEVLESDSGKRVEWEASEIGRIVDRTAA